MSNELKSTGYVCLGSKRAAGALALSLSIVMSLAAAGCGESADVIETAQGATTSTVVVASDDILGFEKTPGWTWTSTGQRLSERRTTGLQSFALDAPAFETHLTSQKVSSTAKGLANLADASSQFALDIMLGETVKNPTATSYVQLKVKSAARGLAQTDLGKISLKDLPPGVFKTVKWAIPASVRSKLGGATYTDLIFDLYIHPFDCPSDTIRIDSLRVKSPTAAPAGAGVSLDLIAQRTYGPEVSFPGESHFAAGVVQIPQSFHVKLGKSGPATNTTKLELGYGKTIAYSCTYAAGNVGGTGKSYDFKSCTGGGKVGDLVTADFARLTIVKGDATAGTTKIRAQLAGNPLGDESGRGLVPAMPTFWGDVPAEINQIINDYSTALNAPKKTQERYIAFPVPEFALQHGDGSPRDMLDPNLPPIPNDPPFNKEGHMNPGSGTWDAWWALAGNLTFDGANNHNTSRLEANLSGNVLVWGFPVTVAAMQLVVDTDSGQITSSGLGTPTSHGSLHMFLFGAELPGGGETTAQTGFVYALGDSRTYNAPTIHAWIFSITAGVFAGAGVTSTGDLRLDGFHVAVRPYLNVGAHLAGGIDLGIASGGVDVKIYLLDVHAPIDASLTWTIHTQPTDCNAYLDFLLKADLQLTALGGSADLYATFGPCPFCDHESWNLLRWKGTDLGTQELFNFPMTAAKFPLPDVSACHQNLRVEVTAPSAGAGFFTGSKVVLGGMAARPDGVSSGQGGGGPNGGPGGINDLNTDQPVPCQYWTWTSNNASDLGFPATGCNPVVTMGDTVGQRTISLVVVNENGEAGSSNVNINVVQATPGPLPVILSPTPHQIFVKNEVITLVGDYVKGTEPVDLVWTETIAGVDVEIGHGNNLTTTSPGVDSVLTLTATDANGTHFASVHITGLAIAK